MYLRVSDEYFKSNSYRKYAFIIFLVELFLFLVFLNLYFYFETIMFLVFILILFLMHLYVFDFIYDEFILKNDKELLKKILSDNKIKKNRLKKYREFCQSTKVMKFPIPWNVVFILFISYFYEFFTTEIDKTVRLEEFISTKYGTINQIIATTFVLCSALSFAIYFISICTMNYKKNDNINKIIDEIYFDDNF